MYNSRKKQQWIFRPDGSRVSVKPTNSGRSEPAESDETSLKQIMNAMRRGDPTYWLRTKDGHTLDVLTEEVKARKQMQYRPGISQHLELYKRVGIGLYKVA